MEDHADLIETLVVRIEEYGKTTVELSKLKLVNATAAVVSVMLAHLVTSITVTLFVLILNIGLALWLGELLGKTYYGFFVIAAIYGVAGIISHFFLHRWIRKPVSEIIISQALK